MTNDIGVLGGEPKPTKAVKTSVIPDKIDTSAFQIENSVDNTGKQKICGVILGSAGSGKTTLATTAKDVVILDPEVDGTAYLGSEGYNVDIVKLPRRLAPIHFAELLEKITTSEKKYKTIVFDSVDVYVDHMINFHKPEDKNDRGKTWSVVSNEFALLIDKLKATDLNIFFTAHEKEERDGDIIVKRIDMTGKGSVKALKSKCHIILGLKVEVNSKGKEERFLYNDPTGTMYDLKTRTSAFTGIKKIEPNLQLIIDTITGYKKTK